MAWDFSLGSGLEQRFCAIRYAGVKREDYLNREKGEMSVFNSSLSMRVVSDVITIPRHFSEQLHCIKYKCSKERNFESGLVQWKLKKIWSRSCKVLCACNGRMSARR